MAATLLSLMLAATPPYGERECPEARRERLQVISEAASSVSAEPPAGWRWSSLVLTVTLLGTTYEEGARWSEAVHSGRRTGDGTRARCLAQIHRHPTWMPKEQWLASTGTDIDSTKICLAGAARILSHYSATCVSGWRAENDLEGSLARVVAGYGTGRTCSTDGRPWATRRARLVMRWLRELEAMGDA